MNDCLLLVFGTDIRSSQDRAALAISHFRSRKSTDEQSSQDSWMLRLLSGSSATVRLPSLPGCPALVSTRRPCTSTISATSGSRTFNWTNYAHGYAAPHRCCGFGWPSTPPQRFFPSSIWGPARKTRRIRSSTPCGNYWFLAVSRSSPVTA